MNIKSGFLLLITLLFTLSTSALGPITGRLSICDGETTVLSDSTTGGIWSSSTFIVTIGSSTGMVTALMSGTSTITYTVGSSYVTATLIVNRVSSSYAITGGGNICVGGSGVPIGASGSDYGIDYQLYNGTSPASGIIHGNNSPLSFGTYTSAGYYQVNITDTLTRCTNHLYGYATVTVNPLPTRYTLSFVGGSGAICAGSPGLDLVLSGSQTSASYQLYLGSTPIGSPIYGTGSTLDFGLQSAAGTYRVVASGISTLCTDTMSGTPSITLLASPGPITGASSVCAGATASLGNSITGGTWASANTSIATVGSSSGVVLGLVSGTSTISYRLSSGCYRTISIAVVNLVPPISGSTRLCVGTTSTLTDGGGTWTSSNPSVATIGSTTGVVNPILAGTSRITFTSSGSCGTATTTVTVSSLPTIYTLHLTGGRDTACASAGAHVTLSGSQLSKLYSIYSGAFTFASAYGTGAVIDFGAITAVGTLTAVATDTFSGCSQNMSGILATLTSPGAITGVTTICAGSNTTLSNSTASGFWSSSNTAIATIGSISGIVTGVTAGTAIISYRLGTCYSTSTLNVISLCTGTPVGGVASVVSATVCPGQSDSLYASGYSSTCGILLQWQSSTDGTTWTNISGYTRRNCLINPAATSFYRVKVTCPASGLFAYSSITHITVRTSIASYRIINTLDTVCSSAHFYISACGASSSATVTTYFGDGTVNTSPLIITSALYADVFHTYPNPGTYTIKQVLFLGGIPQDSITFNYEYLACRIFPVKYYFDRDLNCTLDPSDLPVAMPLLVQVDSNGIVIDTISTTSGFYYKSFAPVGTIYHFKAVSLPSGFTPFCPSSGIIADTIQTLVNNYPVKYCAYSLSGGSNFDLEIHSHLSSGRHMADGIITVNNNYSYPQSGLLTLNFSDKYATISANPTPSTVSGHTSTWVIPSISCTNKPVSINYTLRLRDEWITSTWLTPGDTSITTASILPTSGDTDITNNYTNSTDTVKSSYDPNELSVLPGGLVLPCTWLQYTVNFENTGNDTATNITVLDTLSDNIDIRSLRIITATAAMNITYSKYLGHNVVKFDFPNINLLDSSHHNQCNGMLMFKVKTKQALADGVTIPNRVGIYFDDNPVVMTNSVSNSIGINPIVGPTSFCNTTHDTLTCASAGGTWRAANSNATVSGGILTGVFPGTDIISYTITSACTSRTVTKLVNINSSITPSVSMYHGGGDTVCGGVNVTFLASPINGGSTPAYTWKVNGISTGSGSSFTYLPVNLDMVSVILKSNATCALPDTAISSHLITVLDPLIPVVGINANPGFDIPFATVDTFIATVYNGGISPVFQWMVNNHVVIDAITNTYITDSLHNGDSITCIVTSSGLCSGYSTFNSVGIHVGTEGVSNTNRQFVDVALSPNPNNGEFYLKGNVGNINEPITIDITDMPGRVIYTKLIANSKGSINELIQQGQLASGTYLLNIHSPSAHKIIRFVVE